MPPASVCLQRVCASSERVPPTSVCHQRACATNERVPPASVCLQRACASVPIDDVRSVSVSLGEVVREIVPDPCPEQRRDAPDGRHVILVDVVKDLTREAERE